MVDFTRYAVLNGLFRPVNITVLFAGKRRDPCADGGNDECENERGYYYLSVKMFNAAERYQDAKEAEAANGKTGKYSKSLSLSV